MKDDMIMKNNNMLKTLNFDTYFADALPETYALIMSANLTVHPTVSRITLHG